MVKAKIMYDDEANSLLVYREDRQGKFSVDIGEIIITLDNEYHVTAIEILNPDMNFRVSKQDLERAAYADLQINQRQSLVWVYITLYLKDAKPLETLKLPLSLEKAITV